MTGPVLGQCVDDNGYWRPNHGPGSSCVDCGDYPADVELADDERAMLDAYRDARRTWPDSSGRVMLVTVVPVSPAAMGMGTRRAFEQAAQRGAQKAVIDEVMRRSVVVSDREGTDAHP